MSVFPFGNFFRLLAFCAVVLQFRGGGAALAAETPSSGEAETFKAASRLFEDKLYDLAQTRFADFTARYPGSERREQAVLLQGESLYFLGKLDEADALLRGELPKAGEMGDRFHFWLGEIAFKEGKVNRAVEEYSVVASQYPKSELRGEACYQSTLAISETGDWGRVVKILGADDGPFAEEAAAHPDSEGVQQCLLLLAEARLKLVEYSRSERVLLDLEKRKLSSAISWRRKFLFCKLKIALGDLSSALGMTTNLIQLAASSGRQNWQAESIVMQGDILEKMGRGPEAADLYERNLDALPAAMKKRALFKIVDLAEASDKSTNAIFRLETFVQQDPTNDVADLARLTLGELRLRRTAAELETAGGEISLSSSNALLLALTNFSQVAMSPRQGDLAARCWLDGGWCHWLLGQRREAAEAFQKAVALLAISPRRAVAQFKLGDAQFALGDFASAQANYRAVLRGYDGVRDLPPGLADQALYQFLRASLNRNDSDAAHEAVRDLIARFPGVSMTDRTLLLYGQAMNQARQPAEARELLASFLARFPSSPLRPEAELALAESYLEGGDYAEAYRRNKAWADANPTNALLPQAVYSEALAAEKAGLSTNSFELMTNFLSRFATDPLAPAARKWVADYYFDREIYPEAEKNYQVLIAQTNAPKSLVEEAALMAARSASARDGLGEAAGYLLQLVKTVDTNSPPLFADAWLFLGDTLFQQFLQSSNKINPDLAQQAISAFSRVTNSLPGTVYEARAWGRIGDCQFQWAATFPDDPRKSDPGLFTSALAAYQAALASPGADVSIREQSAVKIGIVFEREKLPAQALRKYTDVLYEAEPGRMDNYWVSQAGLSAARICEQTGDLANSRGDAKTAAGDFEKSANIYERLAKILPGMGPSLEKKSAALRGKIAKLADAKK
jgi:TolA-binding protein